MRRHLNWVATNMNVPRLRFQGFKGDWLESRINQITSYVDYRGKTPTKVESGVFLVTAKNVRMGYIDYENSKEFIAEDDYGNVMSRGKPVVGDVLITTEAPMGNIASVDRDDIALAQRIIKLRGIQAILQNEFLKYRLQSKQFQEKLTALSSGGTVKGIKGSVLHKIQVLIPAIGEQQKIALFLSKIDQKISLLSKKHEFLVQYKKGVMQKIFSQEIRFKDTVGKNFPEWRIEKISSISSLITKGTTPTSIGCQFTKSGINFIKVESLAANGDFIPNKFAYIDEDCHKKLARSQLEKNDILFSIAGAIGRIAIVKEELLRPLTFLDKRSPLLNTALCAVTRHVSAQKMA